MPPACSSPAYTSWGQIKQFPLLSLARPGPFSITLLPARWVLAPPVVVPLIIHLPGNCLPDLSLPSSSIPSDQPQASLAPPSPHPQRFCVYTDWPYSLGSTGKHYLATVLDTGPTCTIGFVDFRLIVCPLIHTFTEHIIGMEPHTSAEVTVASLKSSAIGT